MHALVEDFVQHLRNERGQSENTQKTYFALLNQFVAWAGKQGLGDWRAVQLSHLMAFLQHERDGVPLTESAEETQDPLHGPRLATLGGDRPAGAGRGADLSEARGKVGQKAQDLRGSRSDTGAAPSGCGRTTARECAFL